MTIKMRTAEADWFLLRTALRAGAKRERALAEIAESPRPMVTAKSLLRVHGQKPEGVTPEEFAADLEALRMAQGPVDPVFRGRLTKAKKACRAGIWMRQEHGELMGMLAGAWSPWAEADKREHRKVLNGHHQEVRAAVRGGTER